MTAKNKPQTHPLLIVKRIIIKCNDKHVYDQRLKDGVNIIRGVNGTGKSSIIELLSYGLGGAIKDWTPEQELCTEVFLDVRANYKPLCLKREITTTGKAPTFMCDGSYDKLTNETVWTRYPSARSDKVHSFSQQMFEALNLPSHKTDESQNLTMHQILRLIYGDQTTDSTKILNSDEFDTRVIRRAIGEYLLGIDDLETHNLRQLLITENKRFNTLYGELKGIYAFISRNDSIETEETINTSVHKTRQEIAKLKNELKEVKNKKIESLNEQSKNKINEMEVQSKAVSEELKSIIDQQSYISTEIIDIKHFKKSLEDRLKSLNESIATRKGLGIMLFQHCPSCLTPVSKNTEGHCNLCGSEDHTRRNEYNYLQYSNEINFQLKESSELLKTHQETFQSNLQKINELQTNLDLLSANYIELTSNLDKYDFATSEIERAIGQKEESIKHEQGKLSLIGQIEILKKNKEKSQSAITRLQDLIEVNEKNNQKRSDYVYQSIEEKTISLLKSDGGYEDAFNEAQSIIINFESDKVILDGRARSSASSDVVLKNSARFAIFLHSMEDPKTRLPRFMIMDNIEAQGMAHDRSQNFQRLIVEKCDELTEDYQFIFTTSMIDPDLNESDFVVGPYYEKGMHTLDLPSVTPKTLNN